MDRAALDVAESLGYAAGGWCPRGRLAEDGPIPRQYPLQETPSDEYAERTAWNVRDSDATLVLTRGMPSGGTALTVSLAREAGKPCLVVDLDYPPSPAIVREWLRTHRIDVLNVAGPRESTNPGIYYAAQQYLRDVLADPMCPSRAAEEPRP